MTISNVSKLDLIAQIYSRLGSTSENFWPTREVELSINEALYILASIGNYWKDRIEIQTEANKVFYNLQTDITNNEEAFVNTKTVQDLLEVVNYCLKTNLIFIDVRDILINRINSYVLITGINAVVNNLNIPSPSSSKISLNKRFLDDIRLSYKTIEDRYSLLSKDSEFNVANYFNRNYRNEAAKPRYYSTTLGNPSELSLFPIPLDTGTLELINIEGVDSEVIVDINSKLQVFDNLFFYLKYGVLADILSKDGENQDITRATYCNQRWQEGLQVGKFYSTIILASLNDKDLDLDTISSLDMEYGWQNKEGLPNTLGVVNQNLIAINRKLTSIFIGQTNPYSIGLDVVINVPVSAQYIQINNEYIYYIIEYAIHCLMFKCGSFELKETNDYKDNMLKVAYAHNDRIRASNLNYNDLLGIAKKEEVYHSRGI